MSVGSFCLVLHGHLPYVLRHGTWPHGEAWLFEAAAETYLPLLATLQECEYLNGQPRITLGLTPILLEQLAHSDFKTRFREYLQERIERARGDHDGFERSGDMHFARLARDWEEFYAERSAQFDAIDGDIARAFAELARDGIVEILTSCATHAYLPLLSEDASVNAQVRAGLASSRRILGIDPSGIWLPECAYRPPGPWYAPVPWGEPRSRPGTDQAVAAAGLDHFFVEHTLIEESRSEWVDNHGWHKVDWEEAVKYPNRGWRDPLEPVRVSSNGGPPGNTVVFARDHDICERVWSGDVGYPANGAYLEFHKKRGERDGLRYWRITDRHLDLGGKQPYQPDAIAGCIHEHASHFCARIKQRLHEHRDRTGRRGVLVACFDAELFGHWWFEGPRFVRDVMLTLNADPDVDVCTSAEALKRAHIDKAVALPEGSWGDGGDHRVWVNERVKWVWDIIYRCESTFGKLTFNLPWRERSDLRGLLELAARELLLLQASDWIFIIARDQAIDYGIKRIVLHADRFERITELTTRVAAGGGNVDHMSDLEQWSVRDAVIHDVVFPHIDLNWWNV
ncbi:MAG TPA: 1,4-alpha-glucan branching protein domain-containing protein [Candidatus Krumholzibacteria bacterium]|nr:1,4-alpha-glucan branching protein domain-containing protein [Candidatus Krumholzibacteria bacterium]